MALMLVPLCSGIQQSNTFPPPTPPPNNPLTFYTLKSGTEAECSTQLKKVRDWRKTLLCSCADLISHGQNKTFKKNKEKKEGVGVGVRMKTNFCKWRTLTFMDCETSTALWWSSDMHPRWLNQKTEVNKENDANHSCRRMPGCYSTGGWQNSKTQKQSFFSLTLMIFPLDCTANI